MMFVEGPFIGFLAVFSLLWWLSRNSYPWRLTTMLGLSLVFYGYHHWWFIPIILAYSFLDWGAALLIERSPHRKLVLTMGVALNLTALSVWKYTPLLVETFANNTEWLSKDFAQRLQDNWIVPMGISFYAFIGISYMVDVYRGIIPAERSPWRYALFSAFFPHLVAGPILRAKEFLSHLGPDALPSQPLAAWEGTFLIARGLIKKLVLADSIAAAIDPFFANVTDPSTQGVWSVPFVYLYAFQIYFDFSGYTDMGRGLGLCFGFRWPENFNYPYLATSVQDFWRRWHMTLSRFLRDYLYIPLGGSKHGLGRTVMATMLTMLLGGLWHGASWSFLIWGGLHGLFLVLHRLWSLSIFGTWVGGLKGMGARCWEAMSILLTFNAVCLTWCFFRLTDLDHSLACISKAVSFDRTRMLGGDLGGISIWGPLAIYAAAVSVTHYMTRGKTLEAVWTGLRSHDFLRGAAWGCTIGLIVCALALAQRGQATPFIYFQF